MALGVVDESRSGYEPDDLCVDESVAQSNAEPDRSVLAPTTPSPGLEYATIAGGCFWGLELAMQRVHGIVNTAVGYTQGQEEQPYYAAVCQGGTGHTEAVLVTYDPSQVPFEQILEVFADRTDLTTKDRQGADRGSQYRSGIYFHSEAQQVTATKFLEKVQQELDDGARSSEGKHIVAEIGPAKDFWMAEAYHQQYLEKGGRFGQPQSAQKGDSNPIRCYG